MTLVEQLRAAGCVFAEDEATLLLDAAADASALEEMVARRVAGEPLAHVVGWVEFHGRRLVLGPGVFVPRPRSESLVMRAIEFVRDVEQPVVVDLCCGCGGLGAAIASSRPSVELHASDVDPVAVAYARRNLEPLGGHAYVGDMDGALPDGLRGRVDVLVANVPYVPSCEVALLPRESREHEPRAALDGGDDGLDLARGVAELAPTWLAPGGHVLVEVTPVQAHMLAGVFEWAGLAVRVVSDEQLDATIVVGTRRA